MATLPISSDAASRVPATAVPRSRTATASHRVPWTIWAGVVGVTSASIGGAWDVAWHRSIGRDSFLTPAHLAIYACGVIAAVVCGYLIFATTFGKSESMKGDLRTGARLPRTAGSVHRGLGRRCDVDQRAVR